MIAPPPDNAPLFVPLLLINEPVMTIGFEIAALIVKVLAELIVKTPVPVDAAVIEQVVTTVIVPLN